MTKVTAATSAKAGATGQPEGMRTCGIIMPISDTAGHPASHWRQVQTLLHRAVESAGLTPRNVWDGESTENITGKIIDNLFADPIAVCDISDLNANVMLELGLRLASKKPTIVVREEGAQIPFDIKAFHAEAYPIDLSMLPMEAFLTKISQQLKDKLSAADANEYTPFLANVDVEFLAPTAHPKPFDELVISRLDRISSRLDKIEQSEANPRNRMFATSRSSQGDGVIGVSRTIRIANLKISDSLLNEISNTKGVFNVEVDDEILSVRLFPSPTTIAAVEEIVARYTD